MKRKQKPDYKMTPEEMEEEVIRKYLYGEPMTLEESAYGVWMHEGKKTPKPFSKVYAMKLEQSALKKIRNGLKKYGITELSDVLDLKKSRRCSDKLGADGSID